MSVTKRVTYLKGLAEGLNLGSDTKEEKLLQIIIEVLEEMAVEIEELSENVTAIDDDMSVLVEDMQELEEIFFDEEESSCSCASPNVVDEISAQNEPNVKDTGPQFYGLNCPTCQSEINIEASALRQGVINCPSCKERLELELEE